LSNLLENRGNAYLFGPFIGELSWEFYHFAPLAIYLKKIRPNVSIIVLTREERFDLYGKYADILVPLRLKLVDNYNKENCFKINNYSEKNYQTIAEFFFNKYREKFDIFEHFYPDIEWRYNFKWQYSNSMMNYDFAPRDENKALINSVLKNLDNIVYFNGIEKQYLSGYNLVDDTLKFHIEKLLNNNKTSYLGCIIELLKRCKFVVGKISNDISKLALLLKIPLINLEIVNQDKIRLLNPYKTLVITTNEIQEGVKFYENNI
jgi:hypothetical protein